MLHVDIEKYAQKLSEINRIMKLLINKNNLQDAAFSKVLGHFAKPQFYLIERCIFLQEQKCLVPFNK